MVTGHNIGLPILSDNEKQVFDMILNAKFYDLQAETIFNKARFIKRIIASSGQQKACRTRQFH